MHFLGIDIGSSYTKLTVLDEAGKVLYRNVLKTLNRDKNVMRNEMSRLEAEFPRLHTCATGYGREHFQGAELRKTEIYCASAGVTALHPYEKTILDIGGEDIKVIRSSATGKVEDFYMNSKCAAGTGTFIVEIAERAEIPLNEMSRLAASSTFNKELNSFCTVFAKTEIMQWIFDEVPVQDLARGIYLSIVNRIAKLKIDRGMPLFLIGGVISYHPVLKDILQNKFGQPVTVPAEPQLVNSLGAALLAHKSVTEQLKTET
jgi:(R)-2-hydroxyacyl-CoA dehydratese activating ATPase